MKFFVPSELCKRLKTVAGDTSTASVSKYTEENGSISKYAIILASIRSIGSLLDLGSSKFWRPRGRADTNVGCFED
jgi:hypothetical protein